MPLPSNLPLNFHRDRTQRQLDARLDELLAKLRKNRPSEDPWMVRRAYEIAAERHRDQLRSSGDPYLTHLLEVAHILADMRLDRKSTRLNSSHLVISYAVFCLKKKKSLRARLCSARSLTTLCCLLVIRWRLLLGLRLLWIMLIFSCRRRFHSYRCLCFVLRYWL